MKARMRARQIVAWLCLVGVVAVSLAEYTVLYLMCFQWARKKHYTWSFFLAPRLDKALRYPRPHGGVR